MTDTEKLTININYVDLGQIDLLVQQGLYSNRSDFIRTAIRNQLGAHGEIVKQTVSRKMFGMGVWVYNRRELEKVQASGKQLEIKWIGLAVIGDDVPLELALDTIQSLEVYGVFRAPEAIKIALASRMAKE
jgi:Arc/MetJ-type ribon-helix-helix transcriptional regulator